MKEIIKGSKRYIPMQVIRDKAGSFTIDTAEYTVFDITGKEIQEGSCEIDNSTKEVYFLIDTTEEDFIKGHSYVVEFTVTINGLDKIIKGRVVIKII